MQAIFIFFGQETLSYNTSPRNAIRMFLCIHQGLPINIHHAYFLYTYQECKGQNSIANIGLVFLSLKLIALQA